MLAASIFALAVIAALVTGAFFAARQEMRVGVNSRSSLRAFSAAEAGAAGALARWPANAWNSLVVGDSAALAGSLPGGGGSFAGSVLRLNDELFLVRVTGTDAAGLARRSLASLVRLQPLQVDVRAALTTRGSTTISGAALLDGRDANPASWADCPAAGPDPMAGVSVPSASDITYSGCESQSCIAGNPRVSADPGLGDSTFFGFGELGWSALAAMATKVYRPGDVGPLADLAPVGSATSCDVAAQDNWGDPHRAAGTAGCWGYFPIIRVDGSLSITGGYGQGILLVSGDLVVEGGAEFFGLIMVRGSLTTSGAGGRLVGGVMAANVDGGQNSILGSTVISYSSCSLARALRNGAPVRQLRGRSWAELF